MNEERLDMTTTRGDNSPIKYTRKELDLIKSIHDEASQLRSAEEQEKSSLTSEVQQLREKVQQLSSLNEELKKPTKRKRKTK